MSLVVESMVGIAKVVVPPQGRLRDAGIIPGTTYRVTVFESLVVTVQCLWFRFRKTVEAAQTMQQAEFHVAIAFYLNVTFDMMRVTYRNQDVSWWTNFCQLCYQEGEVLHVELTGLGGLPASGADRPRGLPMAEQEEEPWRPGVYRPRGLPMAEEEEEKEEEPWRPNDYRLATSALTLLRHPMEKIEFVFMRPQPVSWTWRPSMQGNCQAILQASASTNDLIDLAIRRLRCLAPAERVSLLVDSRSVLPGHRLENVGITPGQQYRVIVYEHVEVTVQCSGQRFRKIVEASQTLEQSQIPLLIAYDLHIREDQVRVTFRDRPVASGTTFADLSYTEDQVLQVDVPAAGIQVSGTDQIARVCRPRASSAIACQPIGIE